MKMNDTLTREIEESLNALATGAPLREGVARLLGVLGYRSHRTLEVGSVREFLGSLEDNAQLTDKQRALFELWRSVEIVFQFTGEEIGRKQAELFHVPGFDAGRNESFLFLAVELREGEYGRMQLSDTTRAVNRLFRMPVIVLFRHGSTVTRLSGSSLRNARVRLWSTPIGKAPDPTAGSSTLRPAMAPTSDFFSFGSKKSPASAFASSQLSR